MTTIATTATVDRNAHIGEGVKIGAGCVVEADVVIGDGTELRPNVVVIKGTKIGRDNRIFSGCVLGEEPQSHGMVEPDTELIIGDNNVFREHVTIHRGSPAGGGRTVIGDNNFFMVDTHIGHDCEVGNNITITNGSVFGGHCKIEDKVWVSGLSGVHQFVTIGKYAYLAGASGVTQDVGPFLSVSGSYPCAVRGVNSIGMQRAGYTDETVKAVKQAYQALYRKRGSRPLREVVAQMLEEDEIDSEVKYLLESLQRTAQHPKNRYRELFRK